MYVQLKNINKNFGDCQASKDVSYEIEKGKLIGLLGPRELLCGYADGALSEPELP